MTEKTDYNEIVVPTPEEISSVDRNEWGTILNTKTLNKYIDELLVARGAKTDRPAPDTSAGPYNRAYISEDQTPPQFDITDGVEWRTINVDSHIDVEDDGTQVASSVSAVDFGTNLAVTIPGDGSVTVDASGGGSGTTTTLYMSDYAPSGGVVDTEFESAITDASPDDTILFDHNSYELASEHVIQKPLTIDAVDATISCTNTTNNNASIEFRGGGIQASTTTTSAIVTGQKVIPVTDASLFAVDDRVLLMNEVYAETTDSIIQFASVQAVDTTNSTITLYGTTTREFINGANVHVVDLLDEPAIRNVETDGGGIRHLQFKWCESPLYDGTTVSEYTEVSLYALNCWRPRWFNVTATKPNGRASGEGEPIAIYRCSDAFVESPRIYKCRRGIDFAWGTHDTTIIDPVIQNFSIGGITVHGGDQCGVFSVQGGVLSCDPSAVTGNAIGNSSTAPMHIDGTHIFSRRAGLRCLGPTNATNLTIEPVENTNSGQALLIQASNVNVDNCTITDPTGRFGQPIEINTSNGSVEDISLDFQIAYNKSNAVYLYTTGSSGEYIDGVRLTGSIRADGADQPIFLLSDAGIMDNVHISLDVHNSGGQCVRLGGGTGTFGHVSFEDCHMEASLAAIYSDSALGANSSIFIQNCTFESGGTTISFNDTTQNLFVTNCVVPGSIDSSAVTNAQIFHNV